MMRGSQHGGMCAAFPFIVIGVSREHRGCSFALAPGILVVIAAAGEITAALGGMPCMSGRCSTLLPSRLRWSVCGSLE